MTTEDRTREYFDALLKSYDILVKATEESADRGLKLSQQFMNDVVRRQRAAIELAKKVAADPANYTTAYSAIMEAAVAAQSQALDFAQKTYKESVAASGEARESLDAILAASRSAAEAALALSRDWTAANPFADFFKKGAEMFESATGQAKGRTKASA